MLIWVLGMVKLRHVIIDVIVVMQLLAVSDDSELFPSAVRRRYVDGRFYL
jgi:hypothetical protein